MADPREYNPTVGGSGVDFPGKSVEDVDDVPNHLRNAQTADSRWAESVAGRSSVRPGLPVAGLDGQDIGLIREVHDTYLRVARDGQPDLRVPFEAVLDVTGNRVMLNLNADRLEGMR